MATDGSGEKTKRRALPESAYCWPDDRDRRIAELEAALLQSNNLAARFARAFWHVTRDLATLYPDVVGGATAIAARYWGKAA